jgi:hypothetical protein
MNDYHLLEEGVTYVAYYYNQSPNNETRKYIFVKGGIEGCILFRDEILSLFSAGSSVFGACTHFELATEEESLWLKACIKEKNIVECPSMDIPDILKKLNL